MSKLGPAGKGKHHDHKVREWEGLGRNEPERLLDSEIRTPGLDGLGRAGGDSRRTGG